MLIVKLLRSLFGYVLFTGHGGFPERFLNLCVKYHIPLWDLQSHGEYFSGKTSARAYKRIRPVAYRSGVRVRIAEKHGLPFFSARNKKRVGLLCGVAVSALLIAVLSGHIWTIEVTGNNEIPTETILEITENMGLHIGVRRSRISGEALADGLLENLETLSWAAVNIDNCKAVIEVREAIEQPEILDTFTPSNIIAAEDGILTKIEVFSGTAALPVGSAVLKGDLLISGVVQNLDNSETLKGAQGKVYARVERHLLFSSPAEPFLQCSGVEERKTLFFFGIQLPLAPALGENAYQTAEYLSNGDTVLPVGILYDRKPAFASEFTFATETDALRYAVKNFTAAYKDIWQESTILAESVTFAQDGGVPCVCAFVTCEKEIGVNQEIFVEKISD